jgi:uncharacterized protein YgiM (DUF1202 family)
LRFWIVTTREFFCCGFFLPRPTLKTALIAFQPLTVPSTRIIREYTPQYSKPLSVAAGERVSVGREDDEFPGWKWCRASSGLEGWVPVELLSDASATETAALCDYSSRELAVQPGEEVTIEDSRHEWLLVRNKQGERGWIPASHADFLEGKR